MLKRVLTCLACASLLSACGGNSKTTIPWGEGIGCISYFGSFTECGGDLTGDWELVEGCDAGKDMRMSCYSRGERLKFEHYTITGQANGTAKLSYDGTRQIFQTLDTQCAETYYNEYHTCSEWGQKLKIQGKSDESPICIYKADAGTLNESLECNYAANEIRCERKLGDMFQHTSYKYCVRDDQLFLLSDSGTLLTAFKRKSSQAK